MAELCAPEERYVFRTSDLEQARLFLDANGFAFDIPRRERKALDLFIDSEDLQSTSILYMQRGAPAALKRTDRQSACGDFWIVLPIRETMEGTIGNRVVIRLGTDPGHGIHPDAPPFRCAHKGTQERPSVSDFQKPLDAATARGSWLREEVLAFDRISSPASSSSQRARVLAWRVTSVV